MRTRPTTKRAARRHVAILFLAAAVALPATALGHGAPVAGAKRPSFDSGALRLVGAGGYATERDHRAIRVTVCLGKRYRGRFINVRCETDYDTDRRVKARVGVPGCVRGAWRTFSIGQALDRSGAWSHDASAASAIYRC